MTPAQFREAARIAARLRMPGTRPADELGYRPYAAARGMRGQTYKVG
ncbi:hypothetical protein ACFZAU_14875 [Streptomyces sp. NPDC008238]